ncbi:hypothetical protein BPNPMPFG_006627 (plasmid) [Mesorhizobium sp. AR07]|uniref:hypothetical protein n=1 Tax=Mesorhizobium sp. AR07 TaxID=2865838 RepID=UPI00216020A6|nr:hypothetical protein [Mesorhizobium sp. AR07]UVK48978.1 hypothetical protein BPNPMPFG_006627 [Mesorhizobium sp. AR07]
MPARLSITSGTTIRTAAQSSLIETTDIPASFIMSVEYNDPVPTASYGQISHDRFSLYIALKPKVNGYRLIFGG